MTVPECQTILNVIVARDDGGGDNWNLMTTVTFV